MRTTALWISLAALGAASGQERDGRGARDERLERVEARLAELEQEVQRLRLRLEQPGAARWDSVDDPFRMVPAGSTTDAVAPEAGAQHESPIVSGLIYLRGVQQADGRWASPSGGHDVAVTGLALLAFLGSGHTHRFGSHKRTVAQGLTWLKRRAGQDGLLADATTPLPGFAQAWGTAALCEAYAVSRDFSLKPHAERAAAAQRALQHPSGGFSLGGALEPPNSLSTTQAILALKAAKSAGVAPADVDAALERAGAFLAALTDARGVVGYRRVGDGVSVALGRDAVDDPLFTAGAILGRVFAGQPAKTDAIRRGSERLTWPTERSDPLYLYYGTYAAFQLGGDTWQAWHDCMQRALLPRQGEDGSWEPRGVWGELGGRVATTALNRLTLEIYYRWERVQSSTEPQPR